MARKIPQESKYVVRNVKITSKGVEADQMTPLAFILSLAFMIVRPILLLLPILAFIYALASKGIIKGLLFSELVQALHKILPSI
jgi:hypothetical protein